MKIYNTLTGQIENFQPVSTSTTTLYTCGPTVYDYSHIGHVRTYINSDILKRTLIALNHNVNHVMNITDVGHLTGDSDEGDDKLEKGAKKTGRTVWEVAQYYADYFFSAMNRVNILPANTISRATDHIPDMIELIKKIEARGYTYETKEALYFDITKYDKYGQLSKQNLSDKIKGARGEVVVDNNKKHPADFALWFKRVGRFSDHAMHWDSPWGDGFPGWHIECSAMSMKYLGATIDIHTGGVDHIPVHHENEIAQSESATGKTFVNYWVHYNHLLVEGKKMSKSLNNFFTLEDVIKHDISPMAIRLLFIQTHYRQEMNFTWEAAKAAQAAYNKLRVRINELRQQSSRLMLSQEKMHSIDDYSRRFMEALENDLQTPKAVAVMWEALKSSIPSEDKLDLISEFDQILGLGLSDAYDPSIPVEITELAESRKIAKKAKDYKKADEIRKIISNKGYEIDDTPSGYKIKKSA